MSQDSLSGTVAYPGLTASFISALRSEKAAPAVKTKPSVAFKAIGSSLDGVIIGIGAAAGSPTKLDKDDEYVDKADLTKMAYDFCASRDRTFKANHKEEIAVDLVASWVGTPIIQDGDGVRLLPLDEPLTEDMVIKGVVVDEKNGSHWFVRVRPLDAKIIEIAAKGGLSGFSFGAAVTRESV